MAKIARITNFTKFYTWKEERSRSGFSKSPIANIANIAKVTRIFHANCEKIASENIRFSSLFAAGAVSRGETSATQRQKFHTDEANQCLHNKSGSHGVPNIHLSNFARLLEEFGQVLCSPANELQQNSNACCREDYVPQILTVLLEILRVYSWPLVAFCLPSVIRKQQLKQSNFSVDQSALLTGFRTDFTSSVWNFCRWVADVYPRETSPAAKSEAKRMFSQASEKIEQQMW